VVLPSPVQFDVWGCRGSRNLLPSRSRIGNNTSCYSLVQGEDIYVLDAGRGLAALSHALRTKGPFERVERVHIFVSHAHMDHWEGLKDADWFWLRGNGLQVTIWGNEQTLEAIRAGHAHPSYVPLELLAEGTVGGLSCRCLQPGESQTVQGVKATTAALHHYSGQGLSRHPLESLGYRLQLMEGPVVSYLSDHEPTEASLQTELAMLSGAHLAVYDAHFPDTSRHAHGHGSQEHAANMARRHPEVLVLAGHHGPSFSDQDILATYREFGRGLENFALAIEGSSYVWDAQLPGFRAAKEEGGHGR
jgi:phosphoribosyl 1,2-cyclic phosphodiesterase